MGIHTYYNLFAHLLKEKTVHFIFVCKPFLALQASRLFRLAGGSHFCLAGGRLFRLTAIQSQALAWYAVFRPPAAGYCFLLAGGLLFVLYGLWAYVF
jgi:hypothetical protein